MTGQAGGNQQDIIGYIGSCRFFPEGCMTCEIRQKPMTLRNSFTL